MESIAATRCSIPVKLHLREYLEMYRLIHKYIIGEDELSNALSGGRELIVSEHIGDDEQPSTW